MPMLILSLALSVAVLCGCAGQMTEKEISSSETRYAPQGMREKSLTLIRPVASENDYFVTRVVSASKSSDGKRLVVTVAIEAKKDTNALISLVSDSAQATDNEAGFYKVSEVSGIGQDRCGGIFASQHFTHLTPSSVHTVNFVLVDNMGSRADSVNFAASFCAIREGISMFRLPVSVANVPLGSRA